MTESSSEFPGAEDVADGGVSLAPASESVPHPSPAPSGDAEAPNSSEYREQPSTVPSCRIFLDLFAGASAPVTNALKRLGLLCLQPIGAGTDVLCPEHKQRLRKLCASGIVGLALAAPPCGAFSLVRLKPGGPRPVRTPQFPDGLPQLLPDQLRELTISRELREFVCELLSLVAMRGGVILFENPASSLTWKTRGAEAWMRQFTPYLANVAACAHGMDAFKNWLFRSNHPDVQRLASSCSHPKGSHPPLAGKRSSDGTCLTRLTALCPQSLADAIANIFGFCGFSGRRGSAFSALGAASSYSSPILSPKGRLEDGCGT